MNMDRDRADAKHDELVGILFSRITELGISDHSLVSKIATEIVDSACQIVPPEEPELIIHMITLSEGGRDGARSVKPGNVTLHLGKLMTSAAAGALTLAGGTTAAPWTIPLMALVLWDSLWSHLKVEIGDREATVLWALWINRDDDNSVAKAGLLPLANAERSVQGRAPLSSVELKDATECLRKMGCIKDSAKDPSRWWLREWVRVNFR